MDVIPHLSVAVLLGVVAFYGAFRYLLARQKRDGELVNWTPLEAIGITVAIFFGSQAVGVLIFGMIASLSGRTDAELSALIEGPVWQFVYIFMVEAVSVALLYRFMVRRKTSWSAIGWIKPRLSDIGYTLSGFGVYFVVYAMIISRLVEDYLPVDTDQRQDLGFSANVAGPELIFVFLSLVVLPPIVEEILVRGFLFTGLKNKLKLPLAMVVTSIVFAAAHLQWGNDAPLLWTAAIDTFVLSMVLVYVRWRSKSLWPGIGIHFIKNGIAFLALFIFKVV